MRKMISVGLAVWLSVPWSSAGPTEEAIVAMMRLSQESNYSWVATVSDDARTYDIFGQTIRGGFSRVKMPVINSVRRKLGRSVTDTQIDLIFRGNVDCVVETDDGWQKPADLPAWNATATPPLIFGTSSAHLQTTTLNLPGSAGRNAGAPGAYSNLQLGISHPHEELGVMVGSNHSLTVDGDVVSGTLTDLGARLLLVRDGQERLTPISATGSFKLWLRDGMVARYQVSLEGTLDVSVQSGRKRITVRQVTETVIKDIGTTRFDVPPEARAKLEG